MLFNIAQERIFENCNPVGLKIVQISLRDLLATKIVVPTLIHPPQTKAHIAEIHIEHCTNTLAKGRNTFA